MEMTSMELEEKELEIGRIKAPPVSYFETGECSSKDELYKACFSSTSSKESTSSSESSILSLTPLYSYLSDGTRFRVNESNVSRQGRDRQRWERDPATNSLIRLVTGTIPITNDGRILFISSARKKEWILPKGGWDNDERMEQSAFRETYEEAGVLGILGSSLSSVTFETRKSKKRRLEGMKTNPDSGSSVEDPISCSNSSCVSSEDEQIPTVVQLDNAFPNGTAPPRTDLRYGGICRMTLHVLYLTEVLDHWPENGRARKLFTIEEALAMVTRPELKTVLTEVKEKGLYLPSNLR